MSCEFDLLVVSKITSCVAIFLIFEYIMYFSQPPQSRKKRGGGAKSDYVRGSKLIGQDFAHLPLLLL